MLIVVGVIVVWLLNCIKILREYERAVVFRLGRVLGEPKGPGVIFVFVPFDRAERVHQSMISRGHDCRIRILEPLS